MPTNWGSRSFANNAANRIGCGDHTTLHFASIDFSMSAWINPAATQTGCIMFQDRNNTGSTNQGPAFYLNSNTPSVNFQGIGTSTASAATTVPNSTWSQVGFTYSTSANQCQVYINGVASGSLATMQALSYSGSPNGFWIGVIDAAGSFSTPFNGQIADCAVWTRKLSASEMASLGKGARPGTLPGNLVLWMPLDGLQSTEEDLSGNAFNGTITGTVNPAFGPPYAPLTPRWPQNLFVTAAFNPAWAIGKNIVIEGVAT